MAYRIPFSISLRYILHGIHFTCINILPQGFTSSRKLATDIMKWPLHIVSKQLSEMTFFFITRVVIALLFYGQSRHKSLIISYSCLKVSVSMPTTNSKKGKKKNIKNWKQSRWQSELLLCHLSNFLLWQRMVVEYAMWQRVVESLTVV